MSYIGELLVSSTIELAAIAHYKKWEETYLAEVERLTGREPRKIPKIRSYSIKNDLEKFPEEQTPAMVIVSPGIVADSIEREGDGVYSAQWDIGIAVVASSRDETTTDSMRAAYAAAVRAVFLQHPSVEGGGTIEEWVDESYSDLPVEADRTLAVAQLLFRIRAEAIVDASGGLREPLEDPYEIFKHPTVEETSTTTSKIGD